MPQLLLLNDDLNIKQPHSRSGDQQVLVEEFCLNNNIATEKARKIMKNLILL
jgi:hypothetical protein